MSPILAELSRCFGCFACAVKNLKNLLNIRSLSMKQELILIKVGEIALKGLNAPLRYDADEEH